MPRVDQSGAPPPRAESGKARSGGWFRPDIEGIRGLAIGAVLLSHAGFAWAEGGFIGIDLFFVVSGFLITTLLVRELETKKALSLARFYARRIRRLLPAASVVLIFVVIGSQLVLSPMQNDIVSGDVLASIAYVINWRLAAQSVDYFAQDFETSPLQHFWSLAVEEQFYIVWPIVMIAVTLWWCRRGRMSRTPLAIALLAIGSASLVYSILYTAESPSAAYFSTATRAWELSLGAGLALARLPQLGVIGGRIAAWSGAIAVVASVLLITEATPFPGAVALIPTLGLAALLMAGSAQGRPLPVRLLCTRPFQYVGRISYSLYLWHWPLLVFAAALIGPLSPLEGAAVVAFSFLPAQLSYSLIERPIRESRWIAARPRRAAGILAIGSGAAAVAAVVLVWIQPSVPLAAASNVPGATVLQDDRSIQTSADELRPDPSRAYEDRPPLIDDGCFIGLGETKIGSCVYGDPDSDTTVVMFGDSHLEHFFPPLEELAEQNGWRLVALTKSFCSPAEILQPKPRQDTAEPFDDCAEFREQMLERIPEEDPDLIVVGGNDAYEPIEDGEVLTDRREIADAMVAGYAETLTRLESETGAPVVLTHDVPKSPQNMPECIVENLDSLDRCGFDDPDLGTQTIEERAVAEVPGASLLDVNPMVCPEGVCRAVIGDAVVYRDTGHVTATFAATMDWYFARELPPIGGS